MKNINKILIMMTLLISMSVLAQKPDDGSLRAVLGGCAGGVAIPDDGYDGSIGSMQCMNVAGPGGIVASLSVDLAMEHTWVGDLVVKVVAPNNTISTVMSRPGLLEPADDGTDCCGNRADLVATSPVTFIDGGATSAEDMALANTELLVCQDDGFCIYSPSPGTGVGTDLSDFAGLDSTGTWQVCVGDSGAQDTGNLCPTTVINFNIAVAAEADVVVGPASGSTIDLGSGTGSGAGTITINNAATATADITNLVCTVTGANAANFTVTTPAGPIAPGTGVVVNITGTAAQGQTAVATVTCTYDGDTSNISSTFLLRISGTPSVIPSLNFYGLLLLIAMMMFGAYVVKRKFV